MVKQYAIYDYKMKSGVVQPSLKIKTKNKKVYIMYEVNILVNGSRCRQYKHNGKIFIESKRGSEYTIEVKNNGYTRILAVCSVDGLDILNGKPAISNGPGYVINAYDSNKYDGFRISNDKVAKFVFDYKNNSYADTKNDQSEKNVGVIGVRIYRELVKTPSFYNTSNSPSIWCSNTIQGCSNNDNFVDCCNFLDSDNKARSTIGPSAAINNNSTITKLNKPNGTSNLRSFVSTPEPMGFDMGTKFGESKESKVREVEFERGAYSEEFTIFYASRESLIEMGIPLGNEKQVNFPEAFKDAKYATPPRDWRG